MVECAAAGAACWAVHVRAVDRHRFGAAHDLRRVQLC